MKVFETKLTYKCKGEVSVDALDSPEKVYKYIKASGLIDEHPDQEGFFVIPLNRKNRPKRGIIRVSLGTASSALVHPREVFRVAIMAAASAVIIVHNHPSGDPTPSSGDIRVTRQLREASEIIGINLLDHVIIGDPEYTEDKSGFYSFDDNGML